MLKSLFSDLSHSPLVRRPWRWAKLLSSRLWIRLCGFLRTLPPPFSLGLPRGFYSDLELLTATPPALPGRVILTDQGNPPVTPQSIMVLCGLTQHVEQPWPVIWTRHQNIDLIGTSLVHLKDNRVCAEAGYGKTRVLDDPAYDYFRRRDPELDLRGNWTSLVSRWMSTDSAKIYAHWLDALPRLALLNEFPPDVRILLPNVPRPYQIASLEMLGLLDRCQWTKATHVRIENYYFSAPACLVVCYSPYSVNWLRQTFLPLVKKGEPTPKRFFLRRFGPLRNIHNESEVLDLFRERGWAIVDAGALSFPEQIRLFANAEAICGIHGSDMANIVWCQPGCRILELFCSDYLSGCFEATAMALPSVHYQYLIFPPDNRFSAIVDLKRLKEALRGMESGRTASPD